MRQAATLRRLAGTCIMLGALAGDVESAGTWTFEEDSLDAQPRGFIFERSNGGRPGRWIVRASANAPSGSRVLAQVDTDATRGRFPLAIASQPTLRDAAVFVKCKPIAGTVDQACGVVVRYQNPDNYYIARANALEGNVRFYRVKDGSRRELASWDGSIAANAWHEIRLEARGARFAVDWDGARIIEVTDDTLKSPGRVGLWTKADSVTEFDDLTVTAPSERAP